MEERFIAVERGHKPQGGQISFNGVAHCRTKYVLYPIYHEML
jgi:hypothetical protein